jgi:hypothetical protein
VVFAIIWGAFFDGRIGGFYGAEKGLESETVDRVWGDWGNSFFGGGDFGEAEGRGLAVINDICTILLVFSCESPHEVTTNDSLPGKA